MGTVAHRHPQSVPQTRGRRVGCLSRLPGKRSRPVLRGPRRSNAPGLPDEIWFGILTRQSIRRGTFTSLNALITRIRDHVTHWNTNAEPFTWTATTEEILAKVRWVQTLSVGALDHPSEHHFVAGVGGAVRAPSQAPAMSKSAGYERCASRAEELTGVGPSRVSFVGDVAGSA